MTILNPYKIVDRLREFQRLVRVSLIQSRSTSQLHQVNRSTSADTIYKLDTLVDPIIDDFFEHFARTTMPLVLIAEGLEDDSGHEGARTFPKGTNESDAPLRIILDPIDGTRGLMYDKRSAWALAGAAANNGDATRLTDIEVAVMTELPTSKLAFSDVLWAIKGQGAHAQRESLSDPSLSPLPCPLSPSTATNIDHGFASISNFFPGTKILASELMEKIVREMLGEADVTKAMVFDDQYISTGGQFYELIVGHDRYNADLRPLFYRIQNQPPGLCCHPYDCATALIATEAGVILTNGLGQPLDGPLDTTTGLSWAGFANQALAQRIGPIIADFFRAQLNRA